MTLPFLAVKDFAKHQHYRDRRPPWIKFYGAVLTDSAILLLPETAQAQLFKLWLLASQMGNPLPNNPKFLAGKIGTTGRFYLKELIASGLMIPCEQDASAMLAEVEESASASVRVAREIEDRGQRTEQSSSSSADFEPSRVKLVSMLGDSDRAEQEVRTFLDGLPNDAKRLSWTRNLVSGLEGIGGPLISAGPLLDGMADFNLSDRQQFPYNAAVFRAFVDRAGRPKLERKSNVTGDDLARSAVTSIRLLIQKNGQSQFIPKDQVAALGPATLAAYEALGGADRFLKCEPKDLDWLVKAFAEALRAPGVTHAA